MVESNGQREQQGQFQSVTIQTGQTATVVGTGPIDEDLARMLVEAQQRVSQRCKRIGSKGGRRTQELRKAAKR